MKRRTIKIVVSTVILWAAAALSEEWPVSELGDPAGPPRHLLEIQGGHGTDGAEP